MTDEKDVLEEVDIVDALRQMSQWLWINEHDLRRNVIAKRAADEIVSLRSKLKQAEQKESSDA